MSFSRYIESNKGFTLIEIIMVVVVLGILSVFTFSFIDNAAKTYTTVSKQRMLYQEASYVMERISRELRDAEWVTNSISYPNSIFLYKRDLSATNQIDKNRYVLIFHDISGNNLYRYSRSTSDPFWSPVLSIDNMMARNVSRFVANFTSGSPHVNDRVGLTLELTDPQDNTIRVTMQETISPKNLDDISCFFWWPWWGCSTTNNYANRSFNGDYEDVVQ